MSHAVNFLGVERQCERSHRHTRMAAWKVILGLAAVLWSGGPCLAQHSEVPVVVIRTLPGKSSQPASQPKRSAASSRRSRTVRARSSYRRPRAAVVASTPPRSSPRLGRTTPGATPTRDASAAKSPQARPRRLAVATGPSVRSRPATRQLKPRSERHEEPVERRSPQRQTRVAWSHQAGDGAIADRRREGRRSSLLAATRGRSPVSLNAEGYALLRRGRFADAEAPLRAAVRLRPNFGYALYNLGWSLLGQGKAREAVEPLRESAALQPGRWEPLQKLSEAYAQIGNEELSFETRARARDLRSGSDRRGRRTQLNLAPGGTQLAVRTLLGDAAWVGSTNRREDQYLQERQEFRLREESARTDGR